MISDVLSDAIHAITGYLNHDATAACYTGMIRERIVKLRDDMEELRAILDSPDPHIELREALRISPNYVLEAVFHHESHIGNITRAEVVRKEAERRNLPMTKFRHKTPR